MSTKLSKTLDLHGKICLVTGGSRGIGKGIAVQLAHYGATCYVTGRNIDTLEELNKEVESSGGSGKCIPVKCDHGNDDEIKKLFERIDQENDGKLDLLVNNVYAAVGNFPKEHGFWEQPPESWDVINNVGLRSHYISSTYAAKMMVEKRQGLIINISSFGGLFYLFTVPYGVGKHGKDRMAQDAAFELRKYNVAFVSLWPGLVKTEAMMKSLNEGRTEKINEYLYKKAESTTFVGTTVAALLSAPHKEIMVKTGKILLAVDIAREYGVVDENGIVPQSLLQVNFLLRQGGYNRIANFIPDFIRIPLSLARMIQAYRHS